MSLPQVPKTWLDIRPLSPASLMLPPEYLAPGELEVIMALLRKVCPLRYVLEIGTNIGRTAKAILNEFSDIKRYVGVDVFPGYQFGLESQSRERPDYPGALAKDDPRYALLLSKNGFFDYEYADCDGADFDAVFIDGDHSREAVAFDTELARRMLRSGGIMIWHDYPNEELGVKGFLDERAKAGANIYHIEGTLLAYEIK